MTDHAEMGDRDDKILDAEIMRVCDELTGMMLNEFELPPAREKELRNHVCEAIGGLFRNMVFKSACLRRAHERGGSAAANQVIKDFIRQHEKEL